MAEVIDEHNQKAIEMFLLTADPTGKGSFWIGLTDIFHEGTWIWPSTREEAPYLNWAKGSPTNSGKIEHFAEISNLLDRAWNDCDNECITHKPRAICQFIL